MSRHEGDWLLWLFALWVIRLFVYCVVGIVCAALLIRCANAQTIYADGFEEAAASQGPCDDPLVQPAGWQFTNKSWTQAWSSPDGNPQATFPNSVGFPVPIGASIGGYTVIAFVPQAGQSVGIHWDTAQANPQQGYGAPRPADSMFLGISVCPGDFRMKQGFDPCAIVASGASLFWTTGNSGFACNLAPGVTYYLTVAPVNPQDGIFPAPSHTCSTSAPNSAFGCDVQARHSGQ
jgi:hypothetical protein